MKLNLINFENEEFLYYISPQELIDTLDSLNQEREAELLQNGQTEYADLMLQKRNILKSIIKNRLERK